MKIVNYNNLPEPAKVMQEIKDKGYLLCHNVINKDVFLELQNYWISKFDERKKETYDLYRRSFLLRLGDENFWAHTKKENNDYRIKRTEFLWNEMHGLTRSTLCELHRFKNLCLNKNSEDGLNYNDNDNVCFLSMNYYPHDKGFLSEHKDIKEGSIFWMVFNLTIKGKHYEKGGLYIIDREGRRVELDDNYKEGSVLFFDGGLSHGVDRIISSSNTGKISFFPFDYNFHKSKDIPNYIKTIIKMNDKISKLLGLSNYSKSGLKKIDK
jgi:hypothetical protein